MYIGSCIDDKANIACFAVFARRKTVSSRADDGVFRKSLAIFSDIERVTLTRFTGE